MTSAAVFPGQGSQFVGMAAGLIDSFPDAERLLNEADSVLQSSLSQTMMHGPKDDLDDTLIAQPAIFVTNHIYWSCLGDAVTPAYVLGHSLGELSACLAADVFTFQDGLRIVAKRAQLMSEAASNSNGGMMAVLGLEEALVAQAIASHDVEIANLNCPGQIVVAGSLAGLEASGKTLMELGARKTIRLAVSGPFHSSFMSEAADRFRDFLEDQVFQVPRINWVSNSTAKTVSDPKKIKLALADQLDHSLRWESSVRFAISQGVKAFFEFGPKEVLSGLIRRISADVSVSHASTLAPNLDAL